MTNHTNSTTDSSNHDDNPSSNEIRAGIDQTRASVGNKIDELQARLDPNRLKEQAQESAQEMLSDTANSMTEYVREHKDELLSSVGEAVRRNPLPTALIGLGVGWLLLESMGGNKARDEGREYERRNLRSRSRRGFEGNADRSYGAQGRGPSTEEGYYSLYDEEVYGRSGYAGNAEFANPTVDSYSSGNGQDEHDGQDANPLAKAADTVKESVNDMGQEVKERAGDVKEAVGDAVGDVRRQVGQMGEHTQQSLQQSMEQRGQQMQEWQNRTQHEAQRRGRQVVRNLEDNPLTYGALALAAGAALAMLLPQTRTENRAFGETRDQLVERGQDVMETAKSHAQEVVDEVRPDLEEKARQIISDVKETGTEAVKDAANELRPVVDKAVSKGKEEARSAAQAVGVDPDKVGQK